MILHSVCWSNCREMGMIGVIKESSLVQSRRKTNWFYFAQEFSCLSSLQHRQLVRNFFLPSRWGLKHELPETIKDMLARLNGLGCPFGIETYSAAKRHNQTTTG